MAITTLYEALKKGAIIRNEHHEKAEALSFMCFSDYARGEYGYVVSCDCKVIVVTKDNVYTSSIVKACPSEAGMGVDADYDVNFHENGDIGVAIAYYDSECYSYKTHTEIISA